MHDSVGRVELSKASFHAKDILLNDLPPNRIFFCLYYANNRHSFDLGSRHELHSFDGLLNFEWERKFLPYLNS